ncbi:DUF6491 family protein [Alteromonas gilva]|uniref:DUF6491 family protein n=1 Tax=Alteromonas gilva TaxID=2987522 RepID=A0ABT5L643_9ALTE|nr:DUF6491 family protein [Alteromonas gilva]MDC8831956.1 DUF6491 family protein [Alteromonas gilva]
MKKMFILFVGIFLLTSCASPQLSNKEMVSLIENFVEEQQLERDHTVSAFRLDSYGQLSDEYLIFRSSPSRHFLIKLVPRCDAIGFSAALLLHRRFGNTLSEGSDFVYVPDSLPFRCYINRIYPLSREQHDLLRETIQTEIKELELKEQRLEEAEAKAEVES